jgi:hypothetical protein
MPFVVVADGQRIYIGVFVTCSSSMSFAVPAIVVDRQKVVKDQPPDTLVIERAYPQASFGVGPDPRSDPRIKTALSALHQQKEQELAPVLEGVPDSGAAAITFTVRETAGLRRFGYPVTASLEVRQGALLDAAAARLTDAAGKALAAQFTTISSWPGGSVRGLDVDFTSSLGPMETQSYRVSLTGGSALPGKSGLAVTEGPDEITVASRAIAHKIRRDGRPLLASIINGKVEFLAAEGVTTTLAPGPAEVVKRGPLNVTLRLGPVTLEYVSSKSWVKIAQRAEGPTDLAVDAHFALPESPVLWDLGVESWLYGHFHKPSEQALLRQTPSGWRMLTNEGEPSAVYASGKRAEGWGHIADKQRVVAFGMSDFAVGDEQALRLGADGRFHAAAKRKELTVYFHFVGQPVQVTAVTSPPSMLAPLVVKAGE